MILREAIERYVLWRRAHGAKFTTGANLLRRFLDHADGDAACDAVTTEQVLAYLAEGRRRDIARTSTMRSPASGVTRSAAAIGLLAHAGRSAAIARSSAAIYLLARRACAPVRS